MTEYICNFCNKKYSNKYNLLNHQKTAKFCLDVQNEYESERKKDNIEYKCEYCDKECYRKDSLLKHLSVCKDKELYIISNQLENYKIKCNQLENSLINSQNKLELATKENEQLKVYKELYLEAKNKNVILEEQLK